MSEQPEVWMSSKKLFIKFEGNTKLCVLRVCGKDEVLFLKEGELTKEQVAYIELWKHIFREKK